MTNFDVYKNVHLVRIDFKNSSPRMRAIVTEHVESNNGKSISIVKDVEHVYFTTHDDITSFLDEIGLKTKVVEIKVVK